MAVAHNDSERFGCHYCASAPRLQKVLGCFTDAEVQPVFEMAGQEYKRCPITFRTPQAYALFTMYKENALSASFETKMSWTPKKLAALLYLKYLDELKQPHGN